jgi:hypothetical protein
MRIGRFRSLLLTSDKSEEYTLLVERRGEKCQLEYAATINRNCYKEHSIY